MFLLTITTFIHIPPGFFFAFVILNSILQSAAGSYIQPAVIALASLFGSSAVQAVMGGQGAVGVVVSGVQVLSAHASIWGTTPETVLTQSKDGVAEERSAFIFFALSTVFLVSNTGALAWLTAMPAYKTVVVHFEQRQKNSRTTSGESDECRGLVTGGLSGVESEGHSQIWRVAKANMLYEVAVAYVFIVTLVSHPIICTNLY